MATVTTIGSIGKPNLMLMVYNGLDFDSEYINKYGVATLTHTRVVMIYSGVEFEDIRVERDQWPAIKDSK